MYLPRIIVSICRKIPARSLRRAVPSQSHEPQSYHTQLMGLFPTQTINYCYRSSFAAGTLLLRPKQKNRRTGTSDLELRYRFQLGSYTDLTKLQPRTKETALPNSSTRSRQIANKHITRRYAVVACCGRYRCSAQEQARIDSRHSISRFDKPT